MNIEGVLFVLLALAILFAAVLWFKTLIAIVQSDSINLVKVIGVVVIFAMPPLAIFYQILTSSGVRKDVERAPERLRKLTRGSAKAAGGLLSWLVKK